MSEPTEGVELVDDDVHGFLHTPGGDPVGALALTHGAGGNCASSLLVDIATRWSSAGFVVLRFDMAFRRAKPKGPPHPSKSADDRASIRRATDRLADVDGPLIAAGHSYGGRQMSMLAAEHAWAIQGLVLLSYPLHPPGKPEKARTAHLPDLTVPTLFVSGTKDPFGTPAELSDAIALVPAPTRFLDIDGAGHDLSAAKHHTAERTLEATSEFFAPNTRDRTTSPT
ncbi:MULTISPECIES: alpha/beta family hydrolase [Rhodococcus]|uniref:Alpha/beta hydrolase n=1 Tax=Rhodococcoides kyotonense TaxID=398843 RepID=A0A177YGV7_9NOCA|nr:MULTISPECIES: alpha/beta family hydrolase [Rhodococcus]NIL76859.1 hypothetical protein [Rhodococcus sp. B10]OAK54348.1 alpha/beta hydrolase [Rhodococcus kyotonensis]